MGQDPKSTSPLDPLLLQAYFDGELDADERARVAAHLEVAADDSLRIDALGEMRELVRFDLEQEMETLDLARIWTGVSARLDEAVTTDSPAPEPNPPSRDQPRSLWERVREFFDINRGVLVPAAVIAAVAGLVVTPMLLNDPPPAGVVEVENQRTVVIVEPLTFEGDSMGTVSYTPGTNTPVIWYLGEPTKPVDDDVVPANEPPSGSIDTRMPRQLPRIPIPLDRLLQRLERLERVVLPDSSAPDRRPTSPANGDTVPGDDGPI